MNEYSEGDLVQVERGDVIVRDRLQKSEYMPHRLFLPYMQGRTYMEVLELDGWEISVIEKAKPKVELPSEPGYYRDVRGEHWALHESGRWFGHGDGSLSVEWSTNDMTANGVNFHPLVRLEPRAVTGRVASDWIWIHRDEVIQTTCRDDVRSLLVGFDTYFGVTND